MAKAIATYKCPDCGATVERRIDGFNRRDADSKKEWAEAHPLLCADCYRKHQRKQQREAAAAEKAGVTIEEYIRQNLDKFPYKWLYAAYVVSTATEARDIIDTLTAR